jgi:peroxiredoxin
MQDIIKKVIAVLALLGSTIIAQAQEEQPFIIKGQLGKHPQPAKVYIRYGSKDKAYLDSCTLKEGAFEYKGKAVFPAKVSLLLSRNGQKATWPYDELFFFIDSSIVQLTSKDSAATAEVKGTVLNREYAQYSRILDEKLKTTPPTNTMAFTDLPFWKALEAFVAGYPASRVALTELQSMSGGAETELEIQAVKDLYARLDPSLKTSAAGQKLVADLDQKLRLLPGMAAPDFSQPDTTGALTSLSAYKGKIVLLHFWASWCKPCRVENKHLRELYTEWRDKGFEVVSVSVDQDRGKWIKAILDDKLEWKELSDLKPRNEAAELYKISAYPSTFLLDADGKILVKDPAHDTLKTILAKMLG